MNLDSHYMIGDGHEVCQDYAIHSKNKECIAISDGCSSSPNTDIGARLLATKAIGRNTTYEDILASANNTSREYNLNQTCLDATIITAYSQAGFPLFSNYVNVEIYGDGVIAWITYLDEMYIYDYEFESGAPYYLNYSIDINRNQRYIREYGQEYKLIVTSNIITSGNVETIESKELSPFVMPIKHKLHSSLYPLPRTGVKTIAIFSDGVKTFRDDTEHKSVNYIEVVKELLNFKSYRGDFVKRRLKRYLKQCRKNNISHYDDISMACMYLGE